MSNIDILGGISLKELFEDLVEEEEFDDEVDSIVREVRKNIINKGGWNE